MLEIYMYISFKENITLSFLEFKCLLVKRWDVKILPGFFHSQLKAKPTSVSHCVPVCCVHSHDVIKNIIPVGAAVNHYRLVSPPVSIASLASSPDQMELTAVTPAAIRSRQLGRWLPEIITGSWKDLIVFKVPSNSRQLVENGFFFPS